MPRRFRGVCAGALGVAAALLVGVGAAGCGSSGRVAVSTRPLAATSSGLWKAVHYKKVVLEVPGGWPVIDLSRRPKQCVLFNVHAVYLGHQSADAVCPAQALGRTDAVQIEPLDAETRGQILASPANATINREQVAIEPGESASRSVVASFVGLGVAVTATFGTDSSIANRIVQSVHAATGPS